MLGKQDKCPVGLDGSFRGRWSTENHESRDIQVHTDSSRKKEEADIPRPVDPEINCLPLSQGDGGSSKGQRAQKPRFLVSYRAYSVTFHVTATQITVYPVVPRDVIHKTSSGPAFGLIPISAVRKSG